VFSSTLASEVIVPDGARWLKERAERWTREIQGVTWGTRTGYTGHLLGVMRRIGELGFPTPTSARTVTREMIEAYAHDRDLAPTTRSVGLCLLRLFLKAEGAAIARDDRIWKGPKPVARRRFWLTKEELTALMNAARGRERVAIALAGFNGLRLGEICGLRLTDLRMALPEPSFAFYGKFGKLRDIPMSRVAWGELVPVVAAARSDRVCPFGRTTVDRDIKRACARAGLRAYAPHDLRRTFGRLSVASGMSLTALQAIYGHESIEDTAYYVGLDQAEMRRGIDRFSEFVAVEVPPA